MSIKRDLDNLFAKVLPYFDNNERVTLEFYKEQILFLKNATQEKNYLKWEDLEFEKLDCYKDVSYKVKFRDTYYKLILDSYYGGTNEVTINPIDKNGEVNGKPILTLTDDEADSVYFFNDLRLEVVE